METIDTNQVEVLLVEDSIDDAELTIRSLKRHNLANHIVHVTDGEQALDFIYGRGKFDGRSRLHQPRVIILDLKLPKMNGIEVLQALKADPETESIPVVVLTSSNQESDIVRTYKLGVNSYIVKPVDFEKFTTSVRELGMYWLLINTPRP